MRRAVIHAAIATTMVLTACSSGGDDTDAAPEPDAAASTTAPPGESTPSPGTPSPSPDPGPAPSPAPSPPSPEESTVPPDVEIVVIGTAVATVSGGDTFAEQTGDVERRPDGECLGHATLEGLGAAAEFTVRDLADSEVIGSGTIESTSAEQIGDELPPNWECRFHLRASLSRPAAEIGLQIDGLEEWSGRIEDGELTVVIPNEFTSPKEPSVDSTDVSPSTESSLPAED